VHYQHITLGIKPKQDSKTAQALVVHHHQKTVSNGSTISYPFQTSSINANPISLTTQKLTRAS